MLISPVEAISMSSHLFFISQTTYYFTSSHKKRLMGEASTDSHFHSPRMIHCIAIIQLGVKLHITEIPIQTSCSQNVSFFCFQQNSFFLTLLRMNFVLNKQQHLEFSKTHHKGNNMSAAVLLKRTNPFITQMKSFDC